ARSFLITLTTPLSGVGTYSYAIGNLATGPAVTDFIKTYTRTTTGNPVDQNQNALLNTTTVPALPITEAPDSYANSASVVAGGTGYKVGDILTVLGGTFYKAARLQVTTVA